MRTQRNPKRIPHGRLLRGTTLIETLVAGLLLGSVMLLVVPLVGAVASQQRAAEWQRLAASELDNQMELITALPWDELTPETGEAMPLSEAARSRLPDVTWQVDIQPLKGDEKTLRISLSLQWKQSGGEASPMVRLTSFRTKQEPKP